MTEIGRRPSPIPRREIRPSVPAVPTREFLQQPAPEKPGIARRVVNKIESGVDAASARIERQIDKATKGAPGQFRDRVTDGADELGDKFFKKTGDQLDAARDKISGSYPADLARSARSLVDSNARAETARIFREEVFTKATIAEADQEILDTAERGREIGKKLLKKGVGDPIVHAAGKIFDTTQHTIQGTTKLDETVNLLIGNVEDFKDKHIKNLRENIQDPLTRWSTLRTVAGYTAVGAVMAGAIGGAAHMRTEADAQAVPDSTNVPSISINEAAIPEPIVKVTEPVQGKEVPCKKGSGSEIFCPTPEGELIGIVTTPPGGDSDNSGFGYVAPAFKSKYGNEVKMKAYGQKEVEAGQDFVVPVKDADTGKPTGSELIFHRKSKDDVQVAVVNQKPLG